MDDLKPGEAHHRFAAPTRRTFLWGVGGASALLFGLGERDGVAQIDPNELVGNPTLTYAFDVVRAEDALVLTIELYNLHLVTPGGGAPYLTRVDSSLPCYLVAQFPAQSVGEEAVPLAAQPDTPTYDFNPSADINKYRAHAFDNVQPTRLAFLITTDLNPALEFGNGRAGLLDWPVFQPSVSAGIQSSAPWTGPTPLETSIGAPFGLALSPNSTNRWDHRTGTMTSGANITELWHTRLTVPAITANFRTEYLEYPEATPTVSAVFSNHYGQGVDLSHTPTDTVGITVPLDATQRAGLVAQMSDHYDFSNTAPADVHRLMLTSNGAWLDLHGTWPQRAQTNLIGWSQRSTHGRDHEVVAAEAGYLLPFGHPVTLITRSVRRFESSPTGSPVANIRQSTYLIIRKQDRFLDPAGAPYNPNHGRGLPFTRVRLNVTTTPNLTFAVLDQNGQGTPPTGTSWCLAEDKLYMFDTTAWDWEGNKHTFSMPMAFISGIAARSPHTTAPGGTGPLGEQDGSPEVIGTAYNAYGANGPTGTLGVYVTAQLDGKPVAMGPSSTSGDTTVRVDAMTFGVNVFTDPPPDSPYIDFLTLDEPRLFPVMLSATARIPAVQTVSPGSASVIQYYQPYLDYGFTPGNNKGELFLHVEGQRLSFDSGGGGTHPGVVTPNINVTGLSRSRGPAGGDTNGLIDFGKNGKFDPTGYFSGAKLLGGLSLESIIATGLDLTFAPLINTLRNYPQIGGQPDLTQPPTLTTTISWSPTLQDSPGSSPVFVQRTGGATLDLNATIVASPTGAPSTDVSGELKNFTIKLFGEATPFLELDFDEFSFHSRNGAKPTVKPTISKVRFAGPLEFINSLEQFLPSGPGGNGITVTPTQVTASTSIAIPSVSFGVFSLTNLSFNGAVDLPFTGDPARVRFSFCTREKPFMLSVFIFGGGGFVGIALGTDGMEKLEASFEFGAHIGIDIGIASGSIEVMAGVYFAVIAGNTSGSQSTELTGFVKAHGELNLAVIAVSITFYLSLTYLDQGGSKSVWGEVDVSLDVRVLILSITVHFSVRKEFSGGGDPSFADMYTEAQWPEYVAAFA